MIFDQSSVALQHRIRRQHIEMLWPQVQKQPSRQSEEVRVQVVLLAELVCDGDTGQVFAPVTLHGVDVEEDGQGGEEAQKDQQEDTDLDPLPVHIGTPKAEDRGCGGVEKHCYSASKREEWVVGAGGGGLYIIILSLEHVNISQVVVLCNYAQTCDLIIIGIPVNTYLMYGRNAKDRKNPDTKPQMWAKLSIQGSRPKEKKKAEIASSLANARHGRSRICQLWNSSTNRQARIPNWLPAGPTCSENKTLGSFEAAWDVYGDSAFLIYNQTVPLLCRAGRWMRPGCLWLHSARRWWRFSASLPASLGPSAPSSGRALTPGSAESCRQKTKTKVMVVFFPNLNTSLGAAFNSETHEDLKV